MDNMDQPMQQEYPVAEPAELGTMGVIVIMLPGGLAVEGILHTNVFLTFEPRRYRPEVPGWVEGIQHYNGMLERTAHDIENGLLSRFVTALETRELRDRASSNMNSAAASPSSHPIPTREEILTEVNEARAEAAQAALTPETIAAIHWLGNEQTRLGVEQTRAERELEEREQEGRRQLMRIFDPTT